MWFTSLLQGKNNKRKSTPKPTAEAKVLVVDAAVETVDTFDEVTADDSFDSEQDDDCYCCTVPTSSTKSCTSFASSSSYNSNTRTLHRAIKRKDLNRVRILVETNGASIEATDWHGRTALHVACYKGNATIVQYLVQSCSANVYATTCTGWTALHYSAKYNHVDMISVLISRGGQRLVEAVDVNGYTALLIASRCNNLGMVECLDNDHGANVEIAAAVVSISPTSNDEHWTAFRWACHHNNVAMAHCLLKLKEQQQQQGGTESGIKDETCRPTTVPETSSRSGGQDNASSAPPSSLPTPLPIRRPPVIARAIQSMGAVAHATTSRGVKITPDWRASKSESFVATQ